MLLYIFNINDLFSAFDFINFEILDFQIVDVVYYILFLFPHIGFIMIYFKSSLDCLAIHIVPLKSKIWNLVFTE